MKKIYFKTILTFCILLTSFSQAQTYIIDASGSGNCSANTGIDNPFLCISAGAAINVGTFTDTNTSGTLTAIDMDVYDACNGDFEVFLNNVSVGTGTTTGTNCACESIASNPNITKNISITVTPAIAGAYVVGGVNTISISTSTQQCFYGVEITAVIGTLGVENFNSNNAIKIYPNPASDFITISGLKNRENFRVYDVLGTEIIKGKIIDNGEIAIKNFSNGIYFLKFDNGNTIKFIKE
ncbi:hypothetical protein BTO04_02705 [Polaribacter sp. SA4-10]|uniref:T9SS type A sorting domain-containing protein n=1 Tax=Polaribacter sp. SA4-10 TaxID=754397 RepID=UPI000B3CE410|nr:T9SS type A sorting domain-containing protein [Polaribacter sp. SA4-10]ARV05672.1 hypothetical protein BTO04_02705 [Polaribacter sp. SA4-10]